MSCELKIKKIKSHYLIDYYYYSEWGWKIFEAFENHTKYEGGGYTSLEDVTSIPPGRKDKMETFWLVSIFIISFHTFFCLSLHIVNELIEFLG